MIEEEREERVHAEYDEDKCRFALRYQRNNKRGGLKNLRCFPTCAEQHKERGFCGRSVVVKLHHSQTTCNEFIRSYEHELGQPCIAGFIARAEFVKCDQKGLVELNGVMSYEKMLSFDRSKKQPTKPWVAGEYMPSVSTPQCSIYEFNKDKKGWHYGWASNKHTCNAKHSLQTYIFQPITPTTVKCIALIRSPPFMVSKNSFR